MAFKRFARRAKKVIKKVTGDRYGRTRGQMVTKGIPRMAKDIMYLKSVLNPEKKRLDATFSNYIGQVNGNTDSAYMIVDITPTISQGQTVSTRNGASIKLHSTILKGQIQQQSATHLRCRYKMFVVEVKGEPIASLTGSGTEMNKFLEVNPLTGFTDFNSCRNPDAYTGWRIHASRTLSLPADNFSSQAGRLIDFSIPIKWNKGKGHHLRWDKNSDNLRGGQFCLIVVADNGNISASVANTSSYVMTKDINTGSLANYYIKHYYYDN